MGHEVDETGQKTGMVVVVVLIWSRAVFGNCIIACDSVRQIIPEMPFSRCRNPMETPCYAGLYIR